MTIAIADDETLFRKGVSLMLSEFEGISVIFEAADGQELLDSLAEAASLPDILLLDLNMPSVNGIDAAKTIKEKYPGLKFIVLSSHYSNAYIINMIELGAAAYLSKIASPEEMENAIRKVAEKGFYYDEKVLEVIREKMVKKTRPQLRSPFGTEISEREREVLQLICEEMTASEIAEKLFISPRTVEGHRNNLLLKLGCRNTAGLVAVALIEGLVNVNRIRF